MTTISNIRISELDFNITSEELAALFEENNIAVVKKIALIPYFMDDVEGDVVLFNNAFIEIGEWCDTEMAYDIIYDLNTRNSVMVWNMTIEKVEAPRNINPLFVTNFEEIYKIHNVAKEDDIEACYDSYSPAYSDDFSTSNEDILEFSDSDTLHVKCSFGGLDEYDQDLESNYGSDITYTSNNFGYDVKTAFPDSAYYYNALDMLV